MIATDQLKTDLKGVYNDTLNTTGSADAALDAFLESFCDKLEVWVKSASIQYTGGLMAGDVPVTGLINGGLQ